jgi:hypothetical protein
MVYPSDLAKNRLEEDAVMEDKEANQSTLQDMIDYLSAKSSPVEEERIRNRLKDSSSRERYLLTVIQGIAKSAFRSQVLEAASKLDSVLSEIRMRPSESQRDWGQQVNEDPQGKVVRE